MDFSNYQDSVATEESQWFLFEDPVYLSFLSIETLMEEVQLVVAAK